MHISVHGVVVVLVLFGIESAQVDEPGANALHEPAPRIQNRQVPGAVQLFEQVCVSLVQSNQMKRVGWEGRRSGGGGGLMQRSQVRVLSGLMVCVLGKSV